MGSFEQGDAQTLQLEKEVHGGRVLSKLNNHVIPWLFSLGLLCYLDRTTLSFGAIQLNHDLGFDCATYGFGAGIFFVGYALFQVPLTLGPQRFGSPVWLTGLCLLWGVVTAGSAFLIRGPLSFYLLRFTLGLAESSAFPTMWYHLSLFYSPAEMGGAYAKVSICTSIAQVLGAPLSAGILRMDGVLGVHGWQWLFLLGGGATFFFAIFLCMFLARDPRSASFLTPEEAGWLDARQAASAQASSSHPSKLRAMLDVARDWRVLYLAGVWLLTACAMFGIMFWAPLLISDMFNAGSAAAPKEEGASCGGGHHAVASTSTVALLTTMPYVAASLGSLANARHAEVRNERRLHAAVPLVAGGVLLAATLPVQRTLGPAAGFACLVMAAGTVWSFHGPFFTWPAVFLKGSAGAAAFALINSVGSMGGFAGPYLIGTLSQRLGGYGAPMALLGALLVISGIALLFYPVPGCTPGGPGLLGGDGVGERESLSPIAGVHGVEEAVHTRLLQRIPSSDVAASRVRRPGSSNSARQFQD
ncbi:hypothetical protein ACKKBG_A14040 [Auxenochlorella protothecoides x Auxenochlorella symbiontica]